jgi:hypothetical protein
MQLTVNYLCGQFVSFFGDWLYQECLNFEFNNERYDEWGRSVQNRKECFWNKSLFVFRTETGRQFSAFLLPSEFLLSWLVQYNAHRILKYLIFITSVHFSFKLSLAVVSVQYCI